MKPIVHYTTFDNKGFKHQHVDWELYPTFKCNLKCKHCFLSCDTETKTNNEISIREWLSILAKIIMASSSSSGN